MGERSPATAISSWELTIDGLVANQQSFSLDSYRALPHRDLTFDIHCVTSWTRFDSTFSGIPLGELVDPLPEARFVSFSAYSDRDHHTSLPVEFAMANTWLVHAFEGEPLTTEHGGPVRTVTPGKYFYKSIKWLKRVTLLAEDRLGWWETNSSYHNNADPSSGNERFTTGSLRPEQLRRFLDAPTYDKYRNRVLIGLDLTGWKPASANLQRLHLKNCDLSGIDLAGADLRATNLSLSDLSGATLVGADLSGSDLEGADFQDADLTDANLGHCALSATRFDGASLEGATFAGAWGLVESQANYLESRGVSLTEP